MPGEDTNELMRLRAVQGELTDLPEDNPRATLSSRIRALLLRATGLPQLIHNYGTLALNKTITFATGEDACHNLFSDGSYLYIGLFTSPGKVVKIDLSDFTKVSTLTFATGEDTCRALFSDGSYLYAGLITSPGKVVKINLSNFTKVSTLTFAAGEDYCADLFSDGSYLYAGLDTSPAKVVKIDLSDFTIVSTLTLAAGEDACYALFSDGSYLYLGLYPSPAKVVKIDLSTFTAVSTLTFATNEDKCRALFSDGSYLYAGLNTSPAKVVKIDLSDFTKVSTLTFAAGENICYGLFSDGSYLYAGLYTNPAKVVKIDLSDFTKVSTLTFAVGEKHCRGLFSDGSYLYAGLNTTPGKVVRRYLYPTNATLRERKIDRTYERNVEQSMPLAMYGKVTTYTDITHFKASILGRFGDDFFANSKWYVFVARDAGGASAAPDGELQPITDYTSSDGTFTHLAFTTPLAVGDEVLIVNKSVATAIISGVKGTVLFDNFDDNSKDTDIWDTDTTAGSTTISETAGVTRFANPGTGTAGYSDRPSIETFGKSMVIEADIVLTTGALGTSYEAYIELYKDANNYFQFGFWKDGAANSRGRITYNIAGAGEVTTDVDTTDTDPVSRNYRIIVDEHNVHVYLERSRLATIEFEELNNYIVRMEAGTGGNADVMEVNFDNFLVFSYSEHDLETYRRIESIQGGSESIQTLWNQLNNLLDLGRSGDSASNLHLDMTEQTLWEVTAQDTPFQHIQSNIDLYNMGVNDIVLIRKYQKAKSGGTYRLCEPILIYNNLQSEPLKEVGLFTNQYSAKLTIAQTQNNGIEGAASYAAGPVWVNETVVANSAAVNDMNLLPVGGDAVDDAYYFGGDRPFGKIVLVLGTAGARVTTDWTIVYEYWDGAAWSDVSNISDGTTMFRHAPGTLNITFDVPTDWAVTNAAGSLPFNIYWFRMRISVAGTGGFTQPLGTRAYIYLTVDTETMDALR